MIEDKPRTTTGSVLVVTCRTSVRRLLQSVLRWTFRSVDGVASIDDALELLARTPYDVILLDEEIDSNNGAFGTVRRVRRAGIRVPIVIVTGAGTHTIDDSLVLHGLGVAAVVRRPYVLEQLEETLADVARL